MMLNPSQASGVSSCTYRNVTTRLQVVRTTGSDHPTIERTVLPAQVISFLAEPDDELEVYTYDCSTTLLSERIPCRQLVVGQLMSSVFSAS